MASLVIIFSFIFSFSAAGSTLFAQDTDVNLFSIFVVDCGTSVQLLDYKEAYEVDSNIRHNLEGSSSSDYMNAYLKIMKVFEPGREKVFRFWFQNLDKIRKFVRNTNFGDPKDQFSFVSWTGCTLKTLAKALPRSSQGKSLFIDEVLWSKLNPAGQAGAIFNYFLNIDYIFNNLNENTENTRFFNALIASDQFQSINAQSYPYYYSEILNFRKIYRHGLFFRVKSFLNGSSFSPKLDGHGNVLHGEYASNHYYFNEKNKRINEINFINAKGLSGRYSSSGFFEPIQEREFIIKDFSVDSKKNCLGKYRFTRNMISSFAPSIKLKMKLIGDEIKVLSAGGNFVLDNKRFLSMAFVGQEFVLKKEVIFEEQRFNDIVVELCR
jgi:hypothetical protein